MTPFWQRLILTVVAVGAGALAALVPATAAVAGPAAIGLLAWAHLPRPGDVSMKDGGDDAVQK